MPFNYEPHQQAIANSLTDTMATAYNIPARGRTTAAIGIESIMIRPNGEDTDIFVRAATHKRGENFETTPLPDASIDIRPAFDDALKQAFGRDSLSPIIEHPARPSETFGIKVKGFNHIAVAQVLEGAQLVPQGTQEMARDFTPTANNASRDRSN